MQNKQILKVLVGSQAHGLATETSDHDYRGVYIAPTVGFLSLQVGKLKQVTWIEGATEDDTAYELGHFLNLATKCNPSALEVFKAPVVEVSPEGDALRDLFPHIWSAHEVVAAFGGYSVNQRKKLFDISGERRWKFAVAYIRVLLQGIELLSTGDFHVEIQPVYEGHYRNNWSWFLRQTREGRIGIGAVVSVAETLRDILDTLAIEGPFKDKVRDLDKVNDYLLASRLANWELVS